MNKEQFKEYIIIFKKFLDSSKSLLNKYGPLGNMAYVFNFYSWSFIDTPIQVKENVYVRYGNFFFGHTRRKIRSLIFNRFSFL